MLKWGCWVGELQQIPHISINRYLIYFQIVEIEKTFSLLTAIIYILLSAEDLNVQMKTGFTNNWSLIMYVCTFFFLQILEHQNLQTINPCLFFSLPTNQTPQFQVQPGFDYLYYLKKKTLRDICKYENDQAEKCPSHERTNFPHFPQEASCPGLIVILS